jgi:hypothetical protein
MKNWKGRDEQLSKQDDPTLSAIETLRLSHPPWQKHAVYLRNGKFDKGHFYSGRGVGACRFDGPLRENKKDEIQRMCLCLL